jgi:probable F420-dependent oxidoreductase
MSSLTSQPGKLQIGLVASGRAREAQELEARPVDSLWVGGHIASRNPSPEAIVGLTVLATVTERVAVGSSILLLPLYPPAVVAKQVADLDRLTGGRLILGVGIGGEYPQEFRAVQVPIGERGARATEIIPLLRQLWTATETTHHGRFYDMQDVRIHPPPVQEGGPPIVVGGRKEPAKLRAATLGDGWFPYLYSPRRYAESVATIKYVARHAGRDLAGFHWCVWVFLNLNGDGDLARAEAASRLGGTYDQEFPAMIDRVAAAGTSAEVTAKVRDFYDAGARHFVFVPATPTESRPRVLDQLFGEVVPALRDHARGADATGLD